MASKSLVIRDYKTQVPGALSEDRKSWLFPQINSVNTHGKRTQWRIFVRAYKARPDIQLPNIPDDAFVPIVTDKYDLRDNKTVAVDGVVIHGWYKVDSRVGDGEIRTSVPTFVSKGKNLKSSAATTPFCQALRDAYGQNNKQLKKAVKEAHDDVDPVRYPPMLAQVMDPKKVEAALESEIVYVQRKYNGVRTVTTLGYVVGDDGVRTPTVIMYSRRGVTYPGFEYIKKELLEVLVEYWEAGQKIYLDGEIYKHGARLQDISGISRREVTATDTTFDYMVYDCFIPGQELTYSKRKEILDGMFDTFEFEYSKQVPTFRAATMGEITTLYQQFLREGFEGAMVRLDRPYKYSYNEHHSSILLKLKPTHDAEFEIVGWEVGTKGKAAGALMIVCKTADTIVKVKGENDTTVDVVKAGITFPVTPAMEIPDRIALAKKMAQPEPTPENPAATHFDVNYRGKPLIVYYDEMSKDNVPQRARTKMEIRKWD